MKGDQRIDRRFAELAAAGRKALIPFVTAGIPIPSRSCRCFMPSSALART